MTNHPPSKTGDGRRAAGGNRTFLLAVLVLSVAGLALDLVLPPRHGHFPFEEWFGFFCFFGLLAGGAVALSSGALRFLIKRDEDYYDD